MYDNGYTNDLPEYECGEKAVKYLSSLNLGGYVVRLGEGHQHWWFARDLWIAIDVLSHEISIEINELEEYMQDIWPDEITVDSIERWRGNK